MTSPSAQKAAGEIVALLYANKWVRFHTKTNTDEAQFASIIQQAITEAVDAAVAQERIWRDQLWCMALVKAQEHPDDLRIVERVTRIFNETRPDAASEEK